MKTNKRGVSLIVLVITIIMMIIIAGAIILALNGSGILGQANKARTNTDEKTIFEQVNMAVINSTTTEGINFNTLNNELEKAGYNGDKIESLPAEVEISGKNMLITKYGKVQNISIPEGYTKLKYIESAGAQYIDTGVLMNNKTTITISYFKRVNDIGWQMYLGAVDNGTASRFVLQQAWSKEQFHYSVNSSFLIVTDSSEYEIVMNSSEFITKDLISNDITDKTVNFNIPDLQSTLYLFCCNYKGKADQFSYIRLGIVKFEKDECIFKYFIPCLDKNDVPCMYDAISGETFYNKGSGTFGYEI